MLVPSVMLLGSAALLATPNPPSPSPPIESWNRFIDGLCEIEPKMLDKLPASMRADPQVRQVVARLILESLASSTIDAISGVPDQPVFLPQLNQTLNIGQPNAGTT